jgi:hypothetical protein
VLGLLRQGHTDVVDADLSKDFDTIPHAELMRSIARRIVDPAMQRLIKQWLYDRVRNFLVGRHKMPPRSIGPFRMAAFFGELGVARPRRCRRSDAMS